MMISMNIINKASKKLLQFTLTYVVAENGVVYLQPVYEQSNLAMYKENYQVNQAVIIAILDVVLIAIAIYDIAQARKDNKML